MNELVKYQSIQLLGKGAREMSLCSNGKYTLSQYFF